MTVAQGYSMYNIFIYRMLIIECFKNCISCSADNSDAAQGHSDCSTAVQNYGGSAVQLQSFDLQNAANNNNNNPISDHLTFG